MLLTSPDYYCFLAVVFFAFWLFRTRGLPLAAIVCAANLYFYSRWGLTYLVLIPMASGIDYFLGHAIPELGKTMRRIAVSGSIAMNLGLIVLCRTGAVPGLGKSALLPLSLSFYAFQALTYTIDIYRGDSKPATSYLRYLSSVAFFPTTLAGPITRVSSLVSQWSWKNVVLTGEEGSRALFLIGLGASKKFLIADYLGNNLVNRVFDLPTLYSGGDVMVAVYAYAFQLYYDFSGYSDIAIGSALLLGIRLPANFNSPYRSANLAEFWTRWHISFSKWLREYLFFSLPFKRSAWMQYAGLVITMALGGIWHGYGWTFLAWGLLHGAGLAGFRFWQSFRKKRSARGHLATVTASLLTFHFVMLGWIFFRSATMGVALSILGQIGSFHYAVTNATPAFLGVLTFAAAAHFFPKTWFDGCVIQFARTPALVQAGALALLTVGIRYMSSTGAAPFIYSKF